MTKVSPYNSESDTDTYEMYKVPGRKTTYFQEIKIKESPNTENNYTLYYETG